MNELSERQKLILALIIRDYIETAQPVGSNRIVEHFKLDFSSATVRNDMVVLTETGYLRQPHTSAGRVPTEEGYRFFVRQLMGHSELPMPTQRTIIHQFYQVGTDMDRWMRLAASVLAHQSQAASLVTAPRAIRPYFKHMELIGTRGRQVLMVLVLSSGEVSQQMLTLAEPVSQTQLSAAAEAISQICHDLDADGISALSPQMGVLEQDLLKLVLDEMRRSKELMTGELYRDGLTHVLAEPEFGEGFVARNALRILEERPLLEDVLTRTVLSSDLGGVQVLIGGEGTWEELRDCTMILARYGVPNLATGTLGVLGPMRMPYGRTIPTVRFMADLLSDLVEDMLLEEEPPSA
jgi:heat-inducible transcriptional repressor